MAVESSQKPNSHYTQLEVVLYTTNIKNRVGSVLGPNTRSIQSDGALYGGVDGPRPSCRSGSLLLTCRTVCALGQMVHAYAEGLLHCEEP
jgi:hypothetical protein